MEFSDSDHTPVVNLLVRQWWDNVYITIEEFARETQRPPSEVTMNGLTVDMDRWWMMN